MWRPRIFKRDQSKLANLPFRFGSYAKTFCRSLEFKASLVSWGFCPSCHKITINFIELSGYLAYKLIGDTKDGLQYISTLFSLDIYCLFHSYIEHSLLRPSSLGKQTYFYLFLLHSHYIRSGHVILFVILYYFQTTRWEPRNTLCLISSPLYLSPFLKILAEPNPVHSWIIFTKTPTSRTFAKTDSNRDVIARYCQS